MYALKIPLLLSLVGSFGRDVLAFSAAYHSHHAHVGHPHKRLLLSSSSGPISVTGEHVYQSPAAGDQRGPCPGLNALANHGYIPRDGVVSLLGATTAMNEVFGFSIELAALLAVMGVVWTGNPLSANPSFSIGGQDSRVQNLLGNLVGLLGPSFLLFAGFAAVTDDFQNRCATRS